MRVSGTIPLVISLFLPNASLGDCGHIFCETCVAGWFDSIQDAYCAKWPRYQPSPVLPRRLRQFVDATEPSSDDSVDRLSIDDELSRYRIPQPRYTCPMCRNRVRTRPVQVGIVDQVVCALGQDEKKHSPLANIRWAKYFDGRLDVR